MSTPEQVGIVNDSLLDGFMINGRPYQPGDWQSLSEIIHDEQQIKGFFGEYRWLTNFAPAQVVLDGNGENMLGRILMTIRQGISEE